MDDVRVQSCHSVVGPHTSKEQVSAHARRGRVGVIVVRRLEGEVSHRGLTGLFTPDLKHRAYAVPAELAAVSRRHFRIHSHRVS